MTPPSPPSPLPSPDTADRDGSPIADACIEQAVGWYVRLASGLQTPADEAAFACWHEENPEHARAWHRLQAMGSRFQKSMNCVAAPVTRTAISQAAASQAAGLSRRHAFKALAWAGAGGTALYLVQERLPWRTSLAGILADLSTATGERRTLTLADGSRLLLNTATAVDVRFDLQQRRLDLRRGEIMVVTARDPAGRPFIVTTRDGTLTPVGTRFTVRRDEETGPPAGFTRLGVSEGAVEVRAASLPSAPPILVHAGEQIAFAAGRAGGPVPLDEAGQSWTGGMLTAEAMRLADFISELARYRPGRLRCGPEVADLRVTGAWPLNGEAPTERILLSLERRLPVRVTRITPYWVTVSAP